MRTHGELISSRPCSEKASHDAGDSIVPGMRNPTPKAGTRWAAMHDHQLKFALRKKSGREGVRANSSVA